jgi:hypothetical protein
MRTSVPPLLLLGALGCLTIVNATEFLVIDRHMGGTYDSISTYESSNMALLASEHTTTVRERFGFYVLIGEFAPGAIIDHGSVSITGLITEQLFGLGRASDVVTTDRWHLPPDLPTLAASATEVMDGESADFGSFTFLIGSDTPVALKLFEIDQTLWIVDTNLLSADNTTMP